MGLRISSVAAYAGLVAVGLFAASPFLCDRLVGTGEAYNYSLSIADAVGQMRDGTVPPLSGESVYAFNGRIHPLRNAPYMFYMAAAVDAVSGRVLEPWQIQNICLTMSLIGAGLATYIGLRRGLGCPRTQAFLLSCSYALAPPLLGAAYSFDLFMTVHAAVFVPLAVAACIRGILRPSLNADTWLAASVAGAWLTHPPIAFWLTAGVFFVRVVTFCSSPSWRTMLSSLFTVALAAGLAAFVFASVVALNPSTSALTTVDISNGLAPLILENLRGVFPDCIRPVPRDASSLGSLQFGYVAWILLGLATAVWLRRPRISSTVPDRERVTSLSALLFAAFLLVLTLPIPFVTFRLWHLMPGVVLELTTIWPMQRLYLVATAFTVFGAGLTLPKVAIESPRRRWIGIAALVLAGGWMVYEARAYVGRGYADRRPRNETADLYLPSNIDLTETSYAFVGVPPTYMVGVMDPQFEFRILRNGTREIGSSLAAAEATGTPVQTMVLQEGHPVLFNLDSGKRYLLRFEFQSQPVTGTLFITGPVVRRLYSLPSAGQPAAFGMGAAQRHSIPIWTDGKKPERVGILLEAPELNSPAGKRVTVAKITLVEVHPETLPVKLESLTPLRFSVNAPEEGLTIETPRRFIPGYEATVNGRVVKPLISPYRQVMVPVPQGPSTVELECKGPSFVITAFWVSAYCWLAFFLWQFTGAWVPRGLFSLGSRVLVGFGIAVWRHKIVSLAVATAIAAALIEGLQQERRKAVLDAVGPVRIDFTLPYGQTGQSQPIISTGKPGAGAVVFAHFIDQNHISIGADVWGGLYVSQPLEVDFSRTQNLVLSDSALYPLDNPAVAALPPSEVALLRGEVRVELNGVTVLKEKRYAFETTPSEMQLGHTQFVSATNPEFLGDILKTQRLLVPRTLTVPDGWHVHMIVGFPSGRAGTSEPLISIERGDEVAECYVTYLSETRLRITLWSPKGSVLDSGEVKYDPRRTHEIDVIFANSSEASPISLSCRFDGNRLFGLQKKGEAGEPTIVKSDSNAAHAPGVEGHFTGSKMDLSLVPELSHTGPDVTNGPVHLVVTFPSARASRREPLLTAGHAGAADLLYVIYDDSSHIRIGYDHWGVGGAISPPIRIDYERPHEIWISMSSLGHSHLKHSGINTNVMLDGRTVLSSSIAPYPTLPEEITVGKNKIGASTADPDFSGTIEFLERTGSNRMPVARL